MITQAIKSWLAKLSAWWPWKRSVASDYPQVVSNRNKGTAQEAVWRKMVDGPEPQPGVTSIAVEQGIDEAALEKDRLTSEERTERIQTSPLTTGDSAKSSRVTSAEASQEKPKDIPTSTPEQKLAFLHYLVKRGTFNEGFGDGQEPEQYKTKQ